MRAGFARVGVVVCAALVACQLGACAGGSKLKGRAITGSAGIVTVVPDDSAHDDRPGVEGVQVTLRTAGAGGAIIGTATSKADGSFSLTASKQQARGQVEVVAEREGYPRQRGTVVFPGPSHLLLVILPQREGEGEGAGGGDGDGDGQ